MSIYPVKLTQYYLQDVLFKLIQVISHLTWDEMSEKVRKVK